MAYVVEDPTSAVAAAVFPACSKPRVNVLGCAIDRVDLEQAVAWCERLIHHRGFGQHMSINAAKLVALRDDDYLRRSVEQCQLVTADGQSVVWASRLLGDPLPCRVAGIDLMYALLKQAAAKGYGVYVLGARPEVLGRAVERIRDDFPGIRLVGFRDGYYAEEEEAQVAIEIAAARADILFVAMSSPRKEYFLARHGETMGVPFVMGVGGSIDVVAGLTRRAPKLIQRLGLEWFYRLAQEPRRLFRRYLTTNVRFLGLLALQLARPNVASDFGKDLT
jgi:N-acetylglucosaminyldiphosphoundecaprenol N-acetyl-beta-D-mannosaminyltransferase